AIESEHILLGLLREDKRLTERFFHSPIQALQSIRGEIEARTPPEEKVSASVDLPLSSSAKRVLSLAADESERLGHRHIGTEHLLLGILREEKSAAAQILYERGLRLDRVREGIDTFSQQNAQETPDANKLDPQDREDASVLKTVGVGTPFARLLRLLIRKGVIDEDERREITGE
ncbi:MAG TPA: Clp protease N-terminal domain-containing protein, partial [Blastocatellia bacterium]|nr:Clp protease N-terminal domain-containing protein [Blastocatellia bacterium]